MTPWSILCIVLAVVVVAAIIVAALVVPRRGGGPARWRPSRRVPGSSPRRTSAPDVTATAEPRAGPHAPIRDRRTAGRDLDTAAAIETPEPTAGRLQRLRARLARSQSALGRGLLSVLSRENLDDEAWEEIEEALLTADVGVGADHRDRRSAAHPHQGARHPLAGRAARAARRGTGHRAAARPGPHAAHDAVVGPAGRGDGRGRQRHRQDDDVRQARPGARGRRPHRAARRGRHVPRRRRRPAADLGLAGRRRDRARPRGRRPGVGRLRRGQAGHRGARSTPSSSTPPAGCTPRSG